jgi:O-antigen ligase
MISLHALRFPPFGRLQSGRTSALVWENRPSLELSVCGFMAISSLFLGGGTRGGFLSDAILELLAVPAILVAQSLLIESLRGKEESRRGAFWGFALCVAVVLCPLVQLVPLPPWIWAALPGRQDVNDVFRLLGSEQPWMPISVSPNATWLSLLSLLPPIAIFLTAIQLNNRERRRLSLIIVAVGVISVFFGLLQIAQGPNSSLRFFAFTNTLDPVGFFANKNHFAALLYAVLVIAAAWAIDISFKVKSWTDPRTFEPAVFIALTTSILVLIVLIIGEIMARSRAGLGLTIVALVGVFAMMFRDRRKLSGMTPSKVLAGVAAIAALLGIQFALYRILDRFTIDPLEDARIAFGHNTFRAAMSFMPFGSGMGTFVPVYGIFERPEDAIPSIYANHAHDDYLELLLETGGVGMGIVVCFFVWFGIRSVRIWRDSPTSARNIDVSLARAATIIVAVLALHSFVDYPLRTGAIMAIFAFACALLVEPLSKADDEKETRRAIAGDAIFPRLSKRESYREPTAVSPAPPRGKSAPDGGVGKVTTPPQSAGRWGDDIEWPEEWRKSTTKNSPNNN